jgi:hypothetical protein
MKPLSRVRTNKSLIRTEPCEESSRSIELRSASDRSSQVVILCSTRSNDHRPSIDRASKGLTDLSIESRGNYFSISLDGPF